MSCLSAAVVAAASGVLAGASAGLAAEPPDAPPSVVEDFAYPGADQILAQHGLKVFKGDGHIRFTEARTFEDGQCPVGQIQVEKWLDVEPFGLFYCFQSVGTQGFLTLEVPGTFGVRGGNRPVEATAQLPGGEREFDIPPNTAVAINPGTGSDPPTAVLVELRMAEAPPAGVLSSHPFVARITMDERACSGVLVAPRWLATAKSCFGAPDEVGAGGPPQPTTAVVGRADLAAGGGHAAQVVELVPYPERDLVLARLASPAADIAPIALADAAPAVGQPVQTAGYGRSASVWPADQLRVGSFTVAASTTSTLELSRAAGTSTSTCKGDAGGPAFRTVDGRAVLLGVGSRSWQAGCAGVTETRDAAVTVRTDDIAAWIRQNTLDVCQATVEDGFTALYDGRSAPAAGWVAVGTGSATEADCELSPSGGAAMLQFTGRRMPAAFTLRLDWKATARDADSGVVLGLPRATDAAGSRGVEVQIKPDGTGTAATGAINGLKAPTADAQRPLGSWNTYEIAVAQRRLTVRLNGQLVNDYAVTDPARLLASGFVGLQSDPAHPAVRFRNIRVRADQPDAQVGTVPTLYNYGNAQLRMWLLQGVGRPPVSTVPVWDSGVGNWDAGRVRAVGGDFDGDGRNDVAAFYNYDNAHTRLWLFDNVAGPGPVASRMVWDSGRGAWDWSRIRPVTGDFDGDGKTEIGAFYDYGGGVTRLWLFDNVGTSTTTRLVWENLGGWDANRATLVAGDFDADGAAEIGAFYNYGGGVTRLWLFDNVGTSTTTRLVWENLGGWDAARATPVAGDFDADGSTEIAAFYNYGGGVARLWLFDNIAASVATRIVWENNGGWDAARTKPVTGDFDGDGNAEIGAFYNYGGGVTRLWLFTNLTTSTSTPMVWENLGGWDWSRMMTIS